MEDIKNSAEKTLARVEAHHAKIVEFAYMRLLFAQQDNPVIKMMIESNPEAVDFHEKGFWFLLDDLYEMAKLDAAGNRNFPHAPAICITIKMSTELEEQSSSDSLSAKASSFLTLRTQHLILFPESGVPYPTAPGFEHLEEKANDFYKKKLAAVDANSIREIMLSTGTETSS